jgi:CheY-specific phosphatase CheX
MSTPTQAEPSVFPAAIADGVRAAFQATFSSICGSAVTVAPEGASPSGGPGIVGILSFFGDISWTLSLGLPCETASALAVKFAGFDIPFDSPDMGDIVGELANVVAGDIVAQLDARRVKAQMSLPMVARGSDLELLAPGHKPSVRFACDSPQGPFWYKLVVAKAGTAVGRRPGT